MSSSDLDRELLAIEKRKNEHVLIAMATQELLSDKKDIGSWGKALMESEGNTDLANSLYVKHRVQKLQDEISEDLIRKAQEKIAREEAEKKKRELEIQAAEKKAAQDNIDAKRKEVQRQKFIDQHIQNSKTSWNVPYDESLSKVLGFGYSFNQDAGEHMYTIDGKFYKSFRDAYIAYFGL